ncbi:MAG: TetR/AcrR family transcriptional regulator [Clostridia bacterium]|nr:TetR/AcrR family transcriptional regulator [Clostridia bacterium]
METKVKIIASAFELFAKKGISFTLAEVAKEVGIRKASIYAHFESKELLLNEIIDKEKNEYFFEISQENDDLKRIYYGILNYYSNSHTKLLFWKRLLLLPPEAIEPSILIKIHQLLDERFEIVNELIKKEAKKRHINHNHEESICIMFFSLIHGLLSSELIYHSHDINEHYEFIWNQFWKGINDQN